MLMLIAGILLMALVAFSNEVVVILDPIDDFITSCKIRYIKSNIKAQNYLQQRTQLIHDSFPISINDDAAIDRTLLGGVWIER